MYAMGIVLTYQSLSVVLAQGFDIRDGQVDVQAPNVISGDDFSLVCK